MVKSLSKFRLVEKEDVGVELEGRDVWKCRDVCERSIMGRVWGCKLANFSGLKNTFNKLWSPSEDMQVVELGPNYYQFIFKSQKEKE